MDNARHVPPSSDSYGDSVDLYRQQGLFDRSAASSTTGECDGVGATNHSGKYVTSRPAEEWECIADYASDIQLAAWLDVAALALRFRRAFAVDCHQFVLGRASEMGLHTDANAGAAAHIGSSASADFAREWLSRRALPESYSRESDSGLLAKRQGPYGVTRVAALRRWLRMPNRHLLTLLDAEYPKRLRHLDDPPPVLYLQGAIEWVHQPMIAIVGSRRASAQGHESAAFLASELAGRGWSIVSGLADGIDAAAHRATLQHGQRRPPSASTIAVIGTGIDQVYPAANAALRDAIGERGAILSEWPLGTPPKAAHFPQRNRLIAALSHGVVVVEAALRSGSLITARLANELGREVFALPGSIFSPQARGCHALIKEGATLVEGVDDILDGLPPHDADSSTRLKDDRPQPIPPRTRPATPAPRAPVPPPPLPRNQPARPHANAQALRPPPTEAASCAALPHASDEPQGAHDKAILAALGHAAVALDVVCARTGLSAATVGAHLATYEIDGLVSSTGGRFSRLFAADQRTMDKNVLKSTLAAKRAPWTENRPFRAPTGNVVESAADSAPRQTEADESVIRPGQS